MLFGQFILFPRNVFTACAFVVLPCCLVLQLIIFFKFLFRFKSVVQNTHTFVVFLFVVMNLVVVFFSLFLSVSSIHGIVLEQECRNHARVFTGLMIYLLWSYFAIALNRYCLMLYSRKISLFCWIMQYSFMFFVVALLCFFQNNTRAGLMCTFVSGKLFFAIWILKIFFLAASNYFYAKICCKGIFKLNKQRTNSSSCRRNPKLKNTMFLSFFYTALWTPYLAISMLREFGIKSQRINILEFLFNLCILISCVVFPALLCRFDPKIKCLF